MKDEKVVTHKRRLLTDYRLQSEALAEVASLETADTFNSNLIEQDATGNYIWTNAENLEINQLVSGLRENRVCADGVPLRDVCRRLHAQDAGALATPPEVWLEPERIFAMIRRERAARIEAFKRAEISI